MDAVHNEDLILSLNASLSKVREALDTTVAIEQNPSISDADRASSVVVIKAAITSAINTLQNCGSESFLGTVSPAPQVTMLNVIGAGTFVAGSGDVSLLAKADLMDHNGIVTATGETVTVVWSSSDSNIGSVNTSTGVYTPLTPGSITITAKYIDGSVASVPMVVTG